MLLEKLLFVKIKLTLTKSMIKIIIRKWLSPIKFFGRRTSSYLLLLLLPLAFLLVMWRTKWWYMAIKNRLQEPPSTELSPLYEMNLELVLQNIQVLIEPTRLGCGTLKEVLVLVMVASTSSRADLRGVVRETWGKFHPTFFVMGVNIGNRANQTVTNRIEATKFDDLLVFDFLDYHLNQTLKTALIMKWTMEQCPKAQFLFKTEEDVMVNPWIFNKMLGQYGKAQLIGYRHNFKHPSRSEYKEQSIQKLHIEDGSFQYLSGTGYLIRKEYVQIILEKAYHVPMITLEDVYFTYLVAYKELGLNLTHDRRLSPYKPWIKTSCVYWNQASIHGLSAREMLKAWYYLEDLVNKNLGDNCTSFYEKFHVFNDKFFINLG